MVSSEAANSNCIVFALTITFVVSCRRDYGLLWSVVVDFMDLCGLSSSSLWHYVVCRHRRYGYHRCRPSLDTIVSLQEHLF